MRRHPNKKNPPRALVAALSLAAALPSAAALNVASRSDLADLTLEQLSNVVVTSVSRREERVADAPASIYVITAQEIRASGATTLPEVLRLAPNLNIARADAVQYAIAARGFNNVLANKMLVLIDGRIVYTPLFSGVFWEAQDVMIEDIDRVEVISGPGGTLWGANAVNGVINVTTKAAKDTQGALVAFGHGNQETSGAARYGGEIAGGHYRIYAKSADRKNTELENGTDVRDSSQIEQGGFRGDWARSGRTLTVQGDAYSGTVDQIGPSRELAGANLIARYGGPLEGGSFYVQGYFDRTDRFHPNSFKEKLKTYDIEGQHAFAVGKNRIIWGGGYREAHDDIVNSASQAFIPAQKTLTWANVFAQDTYALRDDLDAVVGLKAERNNYTGTEYLPSARLAWRPTSTQLLWTALSRAVRAPSRIDRDTFFPGQPPFVLTPGEFESEIANVLEVGYRAQPSARYSYSVTAYHHDYEKLRSIGILNGRPVFANDLEGRVTGIEAWGRVQVLDDLALSGGFTAMRDKIEVTPGGIDLGGAGRASLGNDPPSWFKVRLSWTPTPRHEVDVFVRHYGPLASGNVPSYTAVDARLGWRVTRSFELALVVQNLTDDSHYEWTNHAVLPRTAFLKVTWRP